MYYLSTLHSQNDCMHGHILNWTKFPKLHVLKNVGKCCKLESTVQFPLSSYGRLKVRTMTWYCMMNRQAWSLNVSPRSTKVDIKKCLFVKYYKNNTKQKQHIMKERLQWLSLEWSHFRFFVKIAIDPNVSTSCRVQKTKTAPHGTILLSSASCHLNGHTFKRFFKPTDSSFFQSKRFDLGS